MDKPFLNFAVVLNDDQKDVFEAHQIDLNHRIATIMVDSMLFFKIMRSMVDTRTDEHVMHPIVNDGLEKLITVMGREFGLGDRQLGSIETIIMAELVKIIEEARGENMPLTFSMDELMSETDFRQWLKRIAARVAKEVL